MPESRAAGPTPFGFGIRFVGLLVLALLLEAALWAQTGWLAAYTEVIARTGGSIYAALGGQLSRTGAVLYPAAGQALEITKVCTITSLLALLAAAVVATPASWQRRAAVLLVGWGMLEVANVLRVAVLLTVSPLWPAALQFLHGVVAPVVLAGLTLSIYVVWAMRSDPARRVRA